MTPERWERLQTLLIPALELEGQEREKYLSVSCEDDPALREEVESLISGHEATGVLDRPVDDLVRPLAIGLDAAEDLSGTEVAQYAIENRLGSGGMGVVYRARDTQLDRTVALKFLPPYLGSSGTGRERFLVEAQVAARLEHPNVCMILEIGETEDGRLFIVMPFYERGTLKKRLLSQQVVPVDEALSIAVQVGRGLAALHERGIVHRDIKPANLILSGEDEVKILDFGIAKLADVSLTQPGQTPGTPAYMSPEQVSGNQVDSRTDLWSLGVVLYEMLAARRPFAPERGEPLILAIQQEDPPPLRSFRPEVSLDLERVVMDLLSKEPDRRLQTADRVVADLETIASGIALRRRPRFRYPGWLRTPLRRAAAVLTVVGLGSLYGVVQSRVPESPSSRAESLYLDARHLGAQVTAEGVGQSNALYQQVLDIDSDHVAALVGLANNYSYQAHHAELPFNQGYAFAREKAHQALAIDPEYAPAHASLAVIASDADGDLGAAVRRLERALELEPSNPDIILQASLLATDLGRLDQAIELGEYVVARDSANPAAHHNLGTTYLNAGRLDEALDSFRTVLDLSPGRFSAQFGISMALLSKGDPEAALAAIQAEVPAYLTMMGLAIVYHALGRVAESDAEIARLIDLLEWGASYNLAYIYAFRGEADLAFERLDKAVQYHDPGLSEIVGESLFANIHSDPRWLPFLERIRKSPRQLAAIRFEVRLPQ